MKNIVVSANCTTGPIADHLRCIYPNANMHTVPISIENYIDKIVELTKSGNNLIFYSARDQFILKEKNILEKNTCIQIPLINFCAFHPDLVYCHRKNDSTILTIPHYNSRIVLFGYENGLSVSQTKKLFSENIFKKMGYLNAWHSEREELKRIFLNANIILKDFDNFFNAIQRSGVFMHSINHPNISTIKELTKILVRKYDASINFDDYNFNLADGLINSYVFPVYPEIANNLSLIGNYSWSFFEKNIKYQLNNLSDYIEFMFENYVKIGFDPNSLNYSITQHQRKILIDEVD
jgi:hypothetical protein